MIYTITTFSYPNNNDIPIPTQRGEVNIKLGCSLDTIIKEISKHVDLGGITPYLTINIVNDDIVIGLKIGGGESMKIIQLAHSVHTSM